MSRFLFVAGDGGGNVPPLLAMVRALVDQGHSVDFLGVPWMEAQVDVPWASSLRGDVAAAGARPVSFDVWPDATAEAYPSPPADKMAAFDNVFAFGFFVPM